MIAFPIQTLMDEQACYDDRLDVLYPQGLHCPRGHPLPASQAPHDSPRAPILDYRCKTWRAVFTLVTNTLWRKSRYRCATIVLSWRGSAQGVPTAHLADALGLDRAHLLELRHDVQPLIEPRFPPAGTQGARGRGG